jgi:glycyl-tRNA synthetase beta chain
MAERVERIAALAREIAPLIEADPDQAETAARLAKGDLASGMVGEFPELQGIMGGYYARAEHGDAIADAIRDHYKPQGPNDTVPTAPLTVAVALADKLDTLVGFFAIEEKPTGSKDPFALRRAALGVIRLLLENNLKVELPVLVGAARRRFASTALAAAGLDKAYLEIAVFMQERTRVALRDRGMRADIVEAAFAQEKSILPLIVRRVEALDAFLATDDGANLLAGYRRASNILKAEEKKGPVPTGEPVISDGVPAQEATLIFAVNGAADEVARALEAEDFAAAMTALALLRAPVDAFFTDVLVNSDVPAERENRLKLLGQVRAIMGRVADFGQVAG